MGLSLLALPPFFPLYALPPTSPARLKDSLHPNLWLMTLVGQPVDRLRLAVMSPQHLQDSLVFDPLHFRFFAFARVAKDLGIGLLITLP